MKWQDYFENRILSRGYDYYNGGYIENVSKRDHLIQATVSGTRKYHIHIDLDDYTQMNCTCPYYEGGNYCKHIAAVLYALENNVEYDEYEDDDYLAIEEYYDDSEEEHFSINELIDLADIDKLKSCLKEIVDNQPGIAIQLRFYLLDNISLYDFKHLKSQIQSIFDDYTEYDNYIDYQDASDFYNDISDCINYFLKPLVKKRYFKETFELCIYIMHKLSYLEIDDSDGYISSISQQCCDIIETVLSHDIDVLSQEKMLKMLLVEVRDSFYSSDLERIVFKYFKDKQCLLLKASYLDKEINDIQKKNQNNRYDYALERWVPHRLDIYYQLETSRSIIQDFIKKYWNLSSLRQYLIQKNINEHHYKEAIYYLKESQNIEFQYSRTVKEYSEQLLQIYKEINHQQDYKDELWKLLTYYDSHNLEHYKLLKKLYSDQDWDDKKLVIIQHYKENYEFLEEIYLEEQMYDLLMKAIATHPGIHSLYKYEDILKPKYEKQLLDKYRSELNIMVSVVRDRKRYQELVDILLRLKKYKTGDIFINQIAAEWKNKYKSRPAMMDELKRIKV